MISQTHMFVYFQDSALHQHLKSVGFGENDVLPEKRNLQKELEEPSIPPVTDKGEPQVEIKNTSSKPVSFFNHRIGMCTDM